MISIRRDEAQRKMRVHRFAVRLYGSIVEQYGIHHEQAQKVLRLVEATQPTRADSAVVLTFHTKKRVATGVS